MLPVKEIPWIGIGTWNLLEPLRVFSSSGSSIFFLQVRDKPIHVQKAEDDSYSLIAYLQKDMLI